VKSACSVTSGLYVWDWLHHASHWRSEFRGKCRIHVRISVFDWVWELCALFVSEALLISGCFQVRDSGPASSARNPAGSLRFQVFLKPLCAYSSFCIKLYGLFAVCFCWACPSSPFTTQTLLLKPVKDAGSCLHLKLIAMGRVRVHKTFLLSPASQPLPCHGCIVDN
jgi:hypothetical protein